MSDEELIQKWIPSSSNQARLWLAHRGLSCSIRRGQKAGSAEAKYFLITQSDAYRPKASKEPLILLEQSKRPPSYAADNTIDWTSFGPIPSCSHFTPQGCCVKLLRFHYKSRTWKRSEILLRKGAGLSVCLVGKPSKPLPVLALTSPSGAVTTLTWDRSGSRSTKNDSSRRLKQGRKRRKKATTSSSQAASRPESDVLHDTLGLVNSRWRRANPTSGT